MKENIQETAWRLRSHLATAFIIIVGLGLIVLANSFGLELEKVRIDRLLAEVGALILVIALIHWLFENYVRENFFEEVRETIVGSKDVGLSGISDFYSNSRDVDFSEYFVTAQDVIVGVNYSPKLIDNCIGLLGERVERKLQTTIVVVKEDSPGEKFLSADYGDTANVHNGLSKIRSIVSQLNGEQSLIKIVTTPTILRYSFVKFDGRIWVIVGTNGQGRRDVPGFFVRHGTPWFTHFSNDIDLLLKRATE